jgi:nucleotide-binding universal stress UspA family protein
MSRFQTLLVPLDFSSHSEKALEYAIAIARRFECQAHLVHARHFPIEVVAPDQVVIPREFRTAAREAVARKLEEALQKVTAAGIKGEVHPSELLPASAITQTAKKIGADLIVMGTRGLTGLKQVLLGSVAERTIRTAPCPVMTVKDTFNVAELARLRTILVPTDFSECSGTALEVARSVAKEVGSARLILIHAYFVPVEVEILAEETQEPLLERISQRAAEELERMRVHLQDDGIQAEFVGDPRRPDIAIVDLADQKGVDLIVMGTHGRTGLAHVLIGSVAARVLRTAPCPVVTVHPEEK